MLVLARPNGDTHLAFFDRWIALIGFVVAAVDMPTFAEDVPLAELPTSPAEVQVRSSTG